MAQRMGLIPQRVVDRQRQILQRFSLPIDAKGVSGVALDQVRQAMSLDKKTDGGAIRWVMLEQIGKATVRQDVPSELVEETLRELIG